MSDEFGIRGPSEVGSRENGVPCVLTSHRTQFNRDVPVAPSVQIENSGDALWTSGKIGKASDSIETAQIPVTDGCTFTDGG